MQFRSKNLRRLPCFFCWGVLFLWFRVAEVHSEREREREIERIWGFAGDDIGEFLHGKYPKEFCEERKFGFL